VLSNQTDRLSKSTLMAYASPAIPIGALGIPLAIYVPPFFAQELGLGLAVVGMVFMLARVWDVFTDPVLGVLSDRYPSRWGRRRHWLALSVPILMLSTYMLFMPNPEDVSAWYLGMWIFILYIGWTLLSLTHQAWGAEVSPNYHERSRITGAREIFIIIGSVFCLLLPSIIEQMNPENLEMARMSAMGWMVIILLPLTILWASLKVKEKPASPVESISWSQTFQTLKKNGPMQRLLASDVLVGIIQNITASLFLFYAADILKLGTWASLILLLNFISGLFYIPLFIALSNKLGKHITLCVCMVLYAVGLNAVWFIPEGAVVATAVLMLLLGMSVGAPTALIRSMMADVVDEDTVKTGKERAGLFFSLHSLTWKLGSALAIGITYLVLAYIGYTPGEANTDTANLGFMCLFILPPVVLSLVIVAIVYRFPITRERQEQNRKILEARKKTDSVSQPVEPELQPV